MLRRLALFLMATAAMGETISDAERARAVQYLHASEKKLLDAVGGLSDAQWNFKPSPERWSAAECAEHITVTEQAIFGAVQKILKAPAEPEKKELARGKDELVVKAVPDRSRKVTAPEAVRPTSRWPGRDALLRQFEETRARTIAFTRSTQDDLRAHFYPHFVLKELDAYQWLLFLAAHCERHTAQILEVKAEAGFPAK